MRFPFRISTFFCLFLSLFFFFKGHGLAMDRTGSTRAGSMQPPTNTARVENSKEYEKITRTSLQEQISYKYNSPNNDDVTDNNRLPHHNNDRGLILSQDSPIESDSSMASTSKINVKDYGAKGDGASDDSTAILKAIQASEGETVFFPRGRYIVSKIIEISKQDVRLEGESGSVIEVQDLSGFKKIGIGFRWFKYKRVFLIYGSESPQENLHDVVIKNLEFVLSDKSARAIALDISGAFNLIRFEGINAEGWPLFNRSGANYFKSQCYDAVSGSIEGLPSESCPEGSKLNPYYFSEASINRFEAISNKISYEGDFDSDQNGTSFQVKSPRNATILNNTIKSSAKGYIFRISGGTFDTVPQPDRGTTSVDVFNNYFESSSPTEYCQVTKAHNVRWNNNTGVNTAPRAHNMIDLFNCFNCQVNNNRVIGGGIAFFGHADQNRGKHQRSLKGARGFTAEGNTIVNPTHSWVFNVGGDRSVGSNAAAHDILIRNNTAILEPGFVWKSLNRPNENYSGAKRPVFIRSFLANNINVEENQVKNLPSFIFSFFDRGYKVSGNVLEDVPELWKAAKDNGRRGADHTTAKTHVFGENTLLGTSGSISEFRKRM